LADRPEDLPDIVRYIVRRRVLQTDGSRTESPAGAEVNTIVDGIVEWVGRNLEAGYPWPGNFRELEQCIRNLIIRNDYQPPGKGEPGLADDSDETFVRKVSEGSLTSDALLERYYAIVLRRAGSLSAASERLGVDWRTLKKRIDSGTLRIRNKSDRPDPAC
jgi:DNA-binding NtrC family response regulator